MKTLIAGAALITCTLAATSPSQAAIDCYRNTSGACTEGKPHALPTSVAEFLALRDKLGKTPQGGATLFIHALMVYNINKPLGEKLITIALAAKNLRKGGTYKGFTYGPSDKRKLTYVKRYAHCIRGYSASATPANGYKLDTKAVTLRFRGQSAYVGSVAGGRYRVFVCGTGIDSCRPMTLLRNSQGFWKTTEWSSFAVGCRPPASKAAADPL